MSEEPNTRMARITNMQATLAKVTDEAQRQDIIGKIAVLAKEELEEVRARNAALPPYPRMVAKFGKRTATITNATRSAAGGWIFDIDLQAGEFLGLGDGHHRVTEVELRGHLQSELGAMVAGQLFPVGVAVAKSAQGPWAVVEAAGPTPAGFMYRLRGMSQPVSQEWIQGYLRG